MRRTILAAAVMALATPAVAKPVEVDLAFGGVVVTFAGLDDAIAGTQEATGYDIRTPIGVYRDIAPVRDENDCYGVCANAFTFEGGVLKRFVFEEESQVLSADGSEAIFEVLDCIFGFRGTPTGYCRTLELDFDRYTVGYGGGVTVDVRPVPVPAGGLLLLSGLWLLRRFRG